VTATTAAGRPTVRRQATLYLPSPHSQRIDALRARFNPTQFALIRAHVTLCRDEDTDDWMHVSRRLSKLSAIELTLAFGAPVRDGNLVTLPATGDVAAFDALRYQLLPSAGSPLRKQHAHITLVHPRNGACSDAQFAQLSRECLPFSATFRAITLIEQVGNAAWRDLATYS
jgi:2'-5' RNA ligase superfamily